MQLPRAHWTTLDEYLSNTEDVEETYYKDDGNKFGDNYSFSSE